MVKTRATAQCGPVVVEPAGIQSGSDWRAEEAVSSLPERTNPAALQVPRSQALAQHCGGLVREVETANSSALRCADDEALACHPGNLLTDV